MKLSDLGCSAGAAAAPAKPAAPKVSFKGKAKAMAVTYTTSKDAAGFRVRCKTGTAGWTTKTCTASKTVTKTITKLKKGKYTVQARAFTKDKAYSRWTKVASVTVK